jgi:predicted AlkP superfamily phosphohydrolase/phosphomutase
MPGKKNGKRLDLILSLLLGIATCGLLGYLIGLRILIWNPDLTSDVRNIFFLLISTVFLYTTVGVAVGIVFWIVLKLFGKISDRIYVGRAFVVAWLALYLLLATLLFGFLVLTRQHLRSGEFDNWLVIAYYLSLLFLCFWLYRSVRTKPDPLSERSRMFTLPKFFLVFAVYLIFALSFALITVSRLPDDAVIGEKAEISSALATPDNGARAAIIGWDGAEWSVLEELLARDEMPNLKNLIANGVSAPFRSLEELKSPLIWTSIATGKLPEKHGIQDFGTFQFAGMPNNFIDYPDGLGLYRLITIFQRSADLPVTSSVRRCKAVWNILSEAQRSSGLVGWWASWPAEKVNGFILSDRFTYTLFNPRASIQSLRTGQTYPPELLNEVEQFCRLPDSITDAEINRFISLGANEGLPADWSKGEYVDWNPMYQFRMAYTSSESFRRAGLYLYQNFRPDFFGIYFEGMDMVSHFFWQYYRPQDFDSVPPEDVKRFGNVIPAFYRYMDETLGEFLNILEPGTDVLILSDHGFGPDPHPLVPYRTGDHRPYGVFVASGPHFRQGKRLEDVSVLDIAPTLLYIFGLPAARDMDGKILVEALLSDTLQARPPEYIKSYETGRRSSTLTRSSADQLLKEQIKALGYTQ